MKKKVFFILALLLMAATGATAQTYNVTVQEGPDFGGFNISEGLTHLNPR